MTDRDRLEADQDHRVYTVPSPTGHPALTCCSHEEPRTRNIEDDVKALRESIQRLENQYNQKMWAHVRALTDYITEHFDGASTAVTAAP
ncbi:hypothetical protein BDQ94DRAFT_176716 [Aspergillus welwitschiae]|uniref:Uncharacterized protein n=1 Tax=Aspergillus welwitschiae TaxID=1341132 RepID=A0A3F3PGW7_9EURO|nr:hypothetical protein BDQ94DRAFT_176716 [Aspergillus welwitschiae]RDH26109.1 hypothetical protein BDQ94DRAFT_176716 [Aspergillus welwitschiae]